MSNVKTLSLMMYLFYDDNQWRLLNNFLLQPHLNIKCILMFVWVARLEILPSVFIYISLFINWPTCWTQQGLFFLLIITSMA
jgi:hypothetical protein